MKCAGLTAFLPIFSGFPSPRGPYGSTVQNKSTRRTAGPPGAYACKHETAAQPLLTGRSPARARPVCRGRALSCRGALALGPSRAGRAHRRRDSRRVGRPRSRFSCRHRRRSHHRRHRPRRTRNRRRTRSRPRSHRRLHHTRNRRRPPTSYRCCRTNRPCPRRRCSSSFPSRRPCRWPGLPRQSTGRERCPSHLTLLSSPEARSPAPCVRGLMPPTSPAENRVEEDQSFATATTPPVTPRPGGRSQQRGAARPAPGTRSGPAPGTRSGPAPGTRSGPGARNQVRAGSARPHGNPSRRPHRHGNTSRPPIVTAPRRAGRPRNRLSCRHRHRHRRSHHRRRHRPRRTRNRRRRRNHRRSRGARRGGGPRTIPRHRPTSCRCRRSSNHRAASGCRSSSRT